MMEWAEREVEIVCKKENPDRKEGEWDYGCACYESATVKYSDVNRVVCVDYYTGVTYSNGFIRNMIDEMFPITMPYLGLEEYKVSTSDFLYDENNGDFDTIRIHHILKPNGEKITVDRYFKESEKGFVEIDIDEYFERYEKRMKR